MSDNLEHVIPDVVYLDDEGRRVSMHWSAAARRFLSSPKFDRCKVSVFAVMDGCGRELSSDEVTINCEPDETERG